MNLVTRTCLKSMLTTLLLPKLPLTKMLYARALIWKIYWEKCFHLILNLISLSCFLLQRLLFSPSNGLGLPTSPSSLDVQNRVLQAAAKHESQPSESEGNQDPALESAVPLNQNVWDHSRLSCANMKSRTEMNMVTAI